MARARSAHIGVVCEEVTERRRTEAALRESEARLRAVFAAIDEGFCLGEMIVDGDGRPVDYRFLEVNPLFEAMSGLAGAVGRTALELQPDLETHWIETYARVGLGGEQLRFQSGSAAMGRWFDVFATPVEPRGRFAVVFKDVTARNTAEAALRESEARFRVMADTAPAMLWITDHRSRCTFLSRGWFDYTATEAEGLGLGWSPRTSKPARAPGPRSSIRVATWSAGSNVRTRTSIVPRRVVFAATRVSVSSSSSASSSVAARCRWTFGPVRSVTFQLIADREGRARPSSARSRSRCCASTSHRSACPGRSR